MGVISTRQVPQTLQKANNWQINRGQAKNPGATFAKPIKGGGTEPLKIRDEMSPKHKGSLSIARH